ncbi:AAA family ATPase [Paracoccus sp. M683]|uniref:ATP-binding protein n=1 Tax=Paracoccus sp. M683 TaxID=2594268 RepID=UPI00117D0EAD|nr:AAA family ATPase [Paracoccus sp. M683]TRW98417.1 AAA family ATPase [Paracoccus sp. M683]
MADDGHAPLSEMIPPQGMRLVALIDTMLALARLTLRLHAAGILHRDLRPDRLLVGVGEQGAQCLGLECAATHRGQSGLAAGDIGASPHHAAPELSGRLDVPIDDPADLYALGVTFAQMISGHVLFADTDDHDLSYAHVAREIPDFCGARDDLPAMLTRITRRMLSKDPDDRYASAFGLVRDLESCAASFDRARVIRDFDLSTKGGTTRFRLGDRLYGREPEKARLLAAVDGGLLQGKRTVVSVSGPSGIGKTAFVTDIRWQPICEGMRLLTGKFDRFKKDRPYLAFMQAARELLRPILSADEPVLAAWRADLQNGLGRFAGLLTELIPELAILIGPQPTPEKIPPAEVNRRFIGMVGRFIGLFSRRQTPMILFFYDVQWADHASLHLLQAISQMP